MEVREMGVNLFEGSQTIKYVVVRVRDSGYTFKQIGKIIGVSKQRVHQIYNYKPKPKRISKPKPIKPNNKYKKSRFKNLSKFLIENGLTQKEFSKVTDIPIRTFEEIFKGNVEPKFNQIKKILKATGKPFEHIFFEEGEAKNGL